MSSSSKPCKIVKSAPDFSINNASFKFVEVIPTLIPLFLIFLTIDMGGKPR